MGCKLEAFILNHQAAEMLPDNLRHLHRSRLNDRLALVPVTGQSEGLPPEHIGGLDIYRHRFTEDWVRDVEGDGDE